MPYIQLSSCNEGQEDLSLQCVGIGKGDLLSLFQKNLDFIYSLCDCTPGTVPQPCDIGLPVSVHNEQGQQFQIVLWQFAEPPVNAYGNTDRQHRANELPGVQPEKDVLVVVPDFFRYFDFYTAFLPSLINRLNSSYNSCILYSKEALNYGY